MEVNEIILLVAGIGVFILSFFVSDKKDKGVIDSKGTRKLIEDMIEQEIINRSSKIDVIVEDTLEETKYKLENSIDKISGEKMMALNEYSETVLEQIRKNHDEVVFLYDMLNTKHQGIKNTIADMNQTLKDAEKNSIEAQKALGKMQLAISESNEFQNRNGYAQNDKIEVAHVINSDFNNNNIETGIVLDKSDNGDLVKKNGGKTTSSRSKGKGNTVKSVTSKNKKNINNIDDSPLQEKNISLQLSEVADESGNSNDRILKLYKEGKSNMAIAKKLGLGLGEVKLVIDLFEGI